MNEPTRVLVVDDHPDNREVFSLMLEHHGFSVQVARDGLEAVQLARKHRPHVILMDLSMPRMDGWKAADLLRKEPVTPAILAVTALDPARADLESGGFRGLLRKPVRMQVLLSAVRQCVSGGSVEGGWISEA